MRRTSLVLILILALATPCLANDFIQPSPVPSSRENIKPTKERKLPASWQNVKSDGKRVKTTRQAQPGQTPPPASIQ